MFLILAIVAGCAAAEHKGEWVELTSKDKSFSILMPGEAKERTTEQKLDQGQKIEVLEYSCTANDCLYRIEKTKVPIEIPTEKLAGSLAAARDRIKNKANIKLISDKETTVAGWPARELVIEAPINKGGDPVKIAMLLTNTGDAVYQVRDFASEADKEPKDARKFFDSFKLVKKLEKED